MDAWTVPLVMALTSAASLIGRSDGAFAPGGGPAGAAVPVPDGGLAKPVPPLTVLAAISRTARTGVTAVIVFPLLQIADGLSGCIGVGWLRRPCRYGVKA